MDAQASIRSFIIDHIGQRAGDGLRARLDRVRTGDEDANLHDLPEFDSLDAVDLCLAVETEFDVAADISDITRVNTLNEFAALIARRAGHGDAAAQTEETGGTMVLLAAGARGATPIYLVHSRGGGLLNYKPLLDSLPGDIPVIGFQMRGIDGKSEPPRTIAAMVDEYVAHIAGSHPGGPCCLAGYSAGGILAQEMARRLAAKGIADIRLAMIDTLCLAERVGRPNLLSRMGEKRFWTGRFLRRQSRRIFRNARKRLNPPTTDKEVGATLPPASGEALRQRIARAFRAAMRRHEFLPYEGGMLLMRAEHYNKQRERSGDALGWQPYILGDIEVVSFAVNHAQIMQRPAVAEVAATMTAYFARPPRN
ncbi:MAG: alpha/beta fold hydrolase [Flavobacteriaceae bacterium]